MSQEPPCLYCFLLVALRGYHFSCEQRYVTEGLSEVGYRNDVHLVQEKHMLSICKITEVSLMIPLHIVYWLQPSFQGVRFESTQFCLFEIRFIEDILHAIKCTDFKFNDKCNYHLNKDMKHFIPPEGFLGPFPVGNPPPRNRWSVFHHRRAWAILDLHVNGVWHIILRVAFFTLHIF